MRKALSLFCLAILLIAIFVVFSSVAAGPSAATPDQVPWWIPKPEPYEAPLSDDGILYSRIAPRLREIETTSNRVRVDVVGQSAGGRDLFLVTVSAPEALGLLGQYQSIRNTMLKDPLKAQEMIDRFGDFKVPIFVNGSIHGDEVTGVDAIMRLIEKLAYDNSPEVREILQNEILLFNVVQNPDGRVLGTRGNANGFDINRDFITQSQPESRAAVKVITEWNPMILLDLHGFLNPMLIEPCTPPHNPNYEYDLYLKWAYGVAKGMEAELLAQTGFTAQIPFEDTAQGWDDWPPIFTPMYAMYHGAYGHTLETPYRDVRGVDAHYAAVWGALRFAARNRQAMVKDQIAIFKRGFLGSVQVPIPAEILAETPYDQFNDLTTIDFPTAYLIPAKPPLQQSPYEAARLVDFLIRNDVEVSQADSAFIAEGASYPAGTYVVWMKQPKRGLANTILWAGWDISYSGIESMYDISGWSQPLAWGATRVEVQQAGWTVRTHPVNRAETVQGSREVGVAAAYAYLPASTEAVRATNTLLARGVAVFRAESAFTVGKRSFGPGTLVVGRGPALENELSHGYGLDLYALPSMPTGLTAMHRQKIAVTADEGVAFVLSQLGFEVASPAIADLNSDALNTGGYEVWVNSSRSFSELSAAGKASVAAFIARGGDYVGIGGTGVPFASPQNANLLTFTSASASADDNGLLKVNYDPLDPVAAQYPAASYGFVYGPLWFMSVGSDVRVSASIASGDFFVSGFWRNWKASDAASKPVVVHGTNGTAEITLIGLNPTFRAHPEHTFRLLANAIYDGLD